MASYTTNLNLKKPAGSENVAIGDINNNMDTIDSAVGALNSKTLINEYISNNRTETFTLKANKSYIIIFSTVSGGNIDYIYAGIVSAPSSTNNTGKIEWLSSAPPNTTSFITSGLTLTITTPSTIWSQLAIKEL